MLPWRPPRTGMWLPLHCSQLLVQEPQLLGPCIWVVLAVHVVWSCFAGLTERLTRRALVRAGGERACWTAACEQPSPGPAFSHKLGQCLHGGTCSHTPFPHSPLRGASSDSTLNNWTSGATSGGATCRVGQGVGGMFTEKLRLRKPFLIKVPFHWPL
ncbi:unnamed protein product [Pipistrellus nathusii]|uniref:Uncharacterized protein n=1 Tax=Pipistrellus nathusii TaxID=59473 RepID=A0ABP0ACQ0_PIPNA